MDSPDKVSRNNKIIETKRITHRSWNGVSIITLQGYESGDIVINWTPPLTLTAEQFTALKTDIDVGIKELKTSIKQGKKKVAEYNEVSVEEVLV